MNILRYVITTILFFLIEESKSATSNQQVHYSCDITDTFNGKKYFGRVLLSDKFMPTVRVIAYEKESIMSKGFTIAFQFLNTTYSSTGKFPNQPTSIKVIKQDASDGATEEYEDVDYPAISTEFTSRGSMRWIKEGSLYEENIYRKYGELVTFKFNNNNPYRIDNFVNELRIRGQMKGLSGDNRMVDLEFKNLEILEGWTFALGLAILALALPVVPCLFTCFCLTKNQTSLQQLADIYSGVTLNTISFTGYTTLVSFVAFIPLVNLFPYQLCFMPVSFGGFFFLFYAFWNDKQKKSGVDKKDQKSMMTTVKLHSIIRLIMFWTVASLVGIIIIFVAIKYIVYLNVLVGIIFQIWDIKAAMSSGKMKQLSLGLSGFYILAFQLSLIGVVGTPINIWFIPTGVTWVQLGIVLGVIIISQVAVYLIGQVLKKSAKYNKTPVKQQPNTSVNRHIQSDRNERRRKEAEMKRKEQEIKDRMADLKKREELTHKEIELKMKEEQLKLKEMEVRWKEQGVKNMNNPNPGQRGQMMPPNYPPGYMGRGMNYPPQQMMHPMNPQNGPGGIVLKPPGVYMQGGINAHPVMNDALPVHPYYPPGQNQQNGHLPIQNIQVAKPNAKQQF